jgi:Protein of unknown function (DUF2975)
MRPENEARLRKIRRMSMVLRWFCKGLLALIVVGFLLAAGALLANRGGSIGYFDVWFRVGDLSLGHRLMVLALSAATSAVWFACIYQLHQLFGNYSVGEIFTRGSVGHLRLMGVACVLWGVMKIAWMGLGHALSANPSGPAQVTAETIPIGIIILVVAWFMDIAVDLQEENELTV